LCLDFLGGRAVWCADELDFGFFMPNPLTLQLLHVERGEGMGVGLARCGGVEFMGGESMGIG